MKRTNLDKSWQISMTFPTALLAGAMFLGSCSDSGKDENESDLEGNSRQAEFQDWPIFRGDPELQGESGEDLSFPLELVWTFEPEVEEGKRRRPIDASPVISGGVLYVGNMEGRFYAVKLVDGSKLWEFKADGPISGPAAVYGDRVFFGDTYGLFYALNTADGSETWRFETDDQIEGGVNVLKSKDGIVRVFFGSHDYFLYCLNAENGEMLWKHETQNLVVATPSIVNSGGQQAVTFGGCDGILHIVPANGEGEPRMIEVGTYIANSSSVRDGIAYVAHNGGEILAIEIESGETVWKIETGQEYRASAAVGQKLLFIPSPDKKLTAYDRVSGEEVWAFQGRKAFDSSPVITRSAIWQAGVDGFLYAVNPTDGSELWNWDVGAKFKASPAISRGTLVLCGDNGLVYGFRSAGAE